MIFFIALLSHLFIRMLEISSNKKLSDEILNKIYDIIPKHL